MRVYQTQLVLLAVGLRDPARVKPVQRPVRVIILPREDTNRVPIRHTCGRLPVAGDLTGERGTGTRAGDDHRGNYATSIDFLGSICLSPL